MIDVAALEQRLEQDRKALDEAALAEVCRLVGIGVRTAQGTDRDAETVTKRVQLIWILCRRLKWPQRRVAQALNRTERQVHNLLMKSGK